MDQPQNISARRMEQLKSMADARMEMGQATALERAVPELVEEISSLREQSSKMSNKVAAAIEDLHNIGAQVSGTHDAAQMAATARQRLRGELGPGPEDEPAAALERENEALRQALSEVVMDLNGRSLPVPEATRKKCEQALGYTFDALAHEWQSTEQRSPGPPRPEQHQEPVIHLHPLTDEHGDAWICANSAALRVLRDAIEILLEDHGPLNSSGEIRVFAADGEGYDLSIEKREGAPHAALWDRLPEPYYVPRRRAREAGMDA